MHRTPARPRAPLKKVCQLVHTTSPGTGWTHSRSSQYVLPVHASKDLWCTNWRKTNLQLLPEGLCTNIFCAQEEGKCPVFPVNSCTQERIRPFLFASYVKILYPISPGLPRVSLFLARPLLHPATKPRPVYNRPWFRPRRQSGKSPCPPWNHPRVHQEAVSLARGSHCPCRCPPRCVHKRCRRPLRGDYGAFAQRCCPAHPVWPHGAPFAPGHPCPVRGLLGPVDAMCTLHSAGIRGPGHGSFPGNRGQVPDITGMRRGHCIPVPAYSDILPFLAQNPSSVHQNMYISQYSLIGANCIDLRQNFCKITPFLLTHVHQYPGRTNKVLRQCPQR